MGWNPENGSFKLDKQLIEEILGGGAEANNPAIVALTSTGDGTISAAALKAGVIARSGATAARTDTTVSAAALLAAIGGGEANVNDAWFVTYQNTTAFPITVAGGAGVTVSGNTIVPPNSVGMFLLTYSADTPAFTLVGVQTVPMASVQSVKAPTTAALESAAMAAADLAGASSVTFINTGTTPGNLQMPTAANLIAAIPNARVGYAYELFIKNGSGSDNTATITTNTGVTLSGTMTIAQNVTRRFVVEITGAATVTVTNTGSLAA